MNASRLADLIAGKCRVRAGGVEGVLDGFAEPTAMWLLVDGKRVEVPFGDVEELEALDEKVVRAHWDAIAAADQEVMRQRVVEQATQLLVSVDDAGLAAVLAHPDVAARIPRGTAGSNMPPRQIS